jgi:hypothetical protein
MKTVRILISLRSLRSGGSADFRDDCRDYQRCHRQERYRCFIYAIIHTSMVSKYGANGLQTSFSDVFHHIMGDKLLQWAL